MIDPKSERRLAENEVVFRQYNESINKGFDAIKQMADEDGQHFHREHQDMPLKFYCECADENCTLRVTLLPDRYGEIHIKRNRFVIIPEHINTEVEKVIQKKAEYWIIEKFKNPPLTAHGLNKT